MSPIKRFLKTKSILLFMLLGTIVKAQTIDSISPNKAKIGQNLPVIISTTGGDFRNGSNTLNITVGSGINSIPIMVQSMSNSGSTIHGILDQSNANPLPGFQDLTLSNSQFGTLSLVNGFFIDTILISNVFPRSGYMGQSFNVTLVSSTIRMDLISSPPYYTGGTNTIATTIVGNRGTDTLEVTVNIPANGTIPAGTYLLNLPTSNGVYYYRNALKVKRTNVSGYVYNDINQNGQLDTNENGIYNIQLVDSINGNIASTNELGFYKFDNLINGTYAIQINLNPNTLLTNPPTTRNVTISSPGSYTEDFGVKAGVNYIDTNFILNVNSIRLRCSALGSYKLTLRNNNFDPLKLVYWFIKDYRLSYDAATVSVADSVKLDTIFYSAILNPGAETSNTIFCLAPGLNLLPLGTAVVGKTSMKAFDLNGIEIPGSSKSAADTEIIRCSFDPNDKQVIPQGADSLNLVLHNSKLNYKIRFQNTGNDTAYQVTIIDTLSNNLNFSTFQFEGSSHTTDINLSAAGILTFDFDNIFLVDSTTNEPLSNGYLKYSIYPNSNLLDSTVVFNRAGIYFDFNPPVITNQVRTTFVSFLVSVNESDNSLNAAVYPNPSKGLFEIKTAGKIQDGRITVYNNAGALIYDKSGLTGNQFQVDLAAYAKGVYYLKLDSGIKSSELKLIVY